MIFLGITKGSYPFKFFLTNLTSFSPSGLPCAFSLPDLLGEPNPIFVTQDITVGFFRCLNFF